MMGRILLRDICRASTSIGDCPAGFDHPPIKILIAFEACRRSFDHSGRAARDSQRMMTRPICSDRANAACCPHRQRVPSGRVQSCRLSGASIPFSRKRVPWISIVSPSMTLATPTTGASAIAAGARRNAAHAPAATTGDRRRFKESARCQIAKLSNGLPVSFIAASNHFGRRPRPLQVSCLFAGLRYFGLSLRPARPERTFAVAAVEGRRDVGSAQAVFLHHVPQLLHPRLLGSPDGCSLGFQFLDLPFDDLQRCDTWHDSNLAAVSPTSNKVLSAYRGAIQLPDCQIGPQRMGGDNRCTVGN